MSAAVSGTNAVLKIDGLSVFCKNEWHYFWTFFIVFECWIKWRIKSFVIWKWKTCHWVMSRNKNAFRTRRTDRIENSAARKQSTAGPSYNRATARIRPRVYSPHRTEEDRSTNPASRSWQSEIWRIWSFLKRAFRREIFRRGRSKLSPFSNLVWSERTKLPTQYAMLHQFNPLVIQSN